jgi:hypothetical protein
MLNNAHSARSVIKNLAFGPLNGIEESRNLEPANPKLESMEVAYSTDGS